MVIATSKLTAQGQISIPAEVRRRLGLDIGSVIEWDEENDEVVVRRATRFTSKDLHEAIFAETPEKKDLDELKEGIRRNVRKRYAKR